MPQPRIIGIAGNASRPSRTRALVEIITAEASRQTEAQSAVFDVAGIKTEIAAVTAISQLTGAPASVLDAIIEADALVVASPVYKGSYTGLFKHLFDLIEPKSLAGKPVIIAATGGSDRHALVLEHQFHPLFAFFGARIVPTNIYATDRDFTDGRTVSQPLAQRIAAAASELAALIPAARSAPFELNAA